MTRKQRRIERMVFIVASAMGILIAGFLVYLAFDSIGSDCCNPIYRPFHGIVHLGLMSIFFAIAIGCFFSLLLNIEDYRSEKETDQY